MATTTLPTSVINLQSKYRPIKESEEGRIRPHFGSNFKFGKTPTETIYHNLNVEMALKHVSELAKQLNLSLTVYGHISRATDAHLVCPMLDSYDELFYMQHSNLVCSKDLDDHPCCIRDWCLVLHPIITPPKGFKKVWYLTYDFSNLRGRTCGGEISFSVVGDNCTYDLGKRQFTTFIPKEWGTINLLSGGILCFDSKKPAGVMVSQVDTEFVKGMNNLAALKTALNAANCKFSDTDVPVFKEFVTKAFGHYYGLTYGSHVQVKIPSCVLTELRTKAMYQTRNQSLLKQLTTLCKSMLSNITDLTDGERVLLMTILPTYVWNDYQQEKALLGAVDTKDVDDYNNLLINKNDHKELPVKTLIAVFVGVLSIATIKMAPRFLRNNAVQPAALKLSLLTVVPITLSVVYHYSARIRNALTRTFFATKPKEKPQLPFPSVPSYCVTSKDSVEPIHAINTDTCTLKISGDPIDDCDNNSVGAYCVGFGIKDCPPVVPHQCVHNQFHALTNRLLLPPAMSEKRLIQNVTWLGRDLFPNLIEVKVSGRSHYVPDLSQYVGQACYLPVTLEEYLERFPKSRSKQIMDAEDNDDFYGLERKSSGMVKVEKLPKISFGPDGIGMGNVKPRHISGAHLPDLAKYGYVLYNCQLMLQAIWNLDQPITFAAGLTAEHLGSWYDEAMDLFPDGCFLENDFSTFDATIEIPLLHFELGFWVSLAHQFGQNDIAQSILENWHNIEPTVNKGVCQSKSNTIKYTHRGKRKSGAINTTSGNSVLNALVLIWGLKRAGFDMSSFKMIVMGDDNLIRLKSKPTAEQMATIRSAAIDLGLKPELVLRGDYDAEFCSGRFYPTVARKSVWAPKIGRVLLKTGWCHLKFDNEKQYNEWYTDVMIGLRANLLNMPIIRQLYKSTKFGVGSIKNRNPYNFTSQSVEPHIYDMTHPFWLEVYDLDISEICKLENFIQGQLAVGPLIDATKSVALQQILMVDNPIEPTANEKEPIVSKPTHSTGFKDILLNYKQLIIDKYNQVKIASQRFLNWDYLTRNFRFTSVDFTWLDQVFNNMRDDLTNFWHDLVSEQLTTTVWFAPMVVYASLAYLSQRLLGYKTYSILIAPFLEEYVKNEFTGPYVFSVIESVTNGDRSLMQCAIRMFAHTLFHYLPYPYNIFTHMSWNALFAAKTAIRIGSRYSLFEQQMITIKPKHSESKGRTKDKKMEKKSKKKIVSGPSKPIKLVDKRGSEKTIPIVNIINHAPYAKITKANDNMTRVKGKDFFKTVTVTTANAVASVIDNFDWRPVRADATNTMLYQIGNTFEKYRLLSLKVHYNTFQSFGVGGGVRSVIRYDPADPVPTTATSINVAYQAQDGCDIRPVGGNYQVKCSAFPNKDPQKFWYTQAQSQEERIVDAFNHLMVVLSTPSANFDIQIWVEYDIEFFERSMQTNLTSAALQLLPNTSINYGQYWPLLASAAAANGLSTNNPLVGASDPTQGLLELPNGAYMIALRYIAGWNGSTSTMLDPMVMLRTGLTGAESAIPALTKFTINNNGANAWHYLVNNTGANQFMRVLFTPKSGFASSTISNIFAAINPISQDTYSQLVERLSITESSPGGDNIVASVGFMSG